MSALCIVFSPRADVMSVPISVPAPGPVTALVITYDPPRRATRPSPPSLRPAGLMARDVAGLAGLIDGLPRQ